MLIKVYTLLEERETMPQIINVYQNERLNYWDGLIIIYSETFQASYTKELNLG